MVNHRSAELFERLQRRARLALLCALAASAVAVFSTALIIEPHLRAGFDAAARFPTVVARQVLTITSLGAPRQELPLLVAPPGAVAPALSDTFAPNVPPETADPPQRLTVASSVAVLLAPRRDPLAGELLLGEVSDGGQEAAALRADAGVRSDAADPTPSNPADEVPPTVRPESVELHRPAAAAEMVSTSDAGARSKGNVGPAELLPLAEAAAVNRSVAVSFAAELGAVGSVPVIVAPVPFWTMITVPPAGSTIEVVVKKIRSQRGRVHCAIFVAPGTGFPWQAGLSQGQVDVPIDDRQAGAFDYQSECDFLNVPRAVYAISVFHDENGNGRFDRNWTSIPIDGRGASNNAKGGFGSVRFADASFSYLGGSQVVSIDMDYLSQ